ncbi:Gfo/Idh/MocA family protein [Mitsuokella sp. WILCCON 0060]|uniref:Gfo/Idh/MocA family protein n=1 Tax=unclassified Mitsuokella TaxID=2637239 RepID=UPI003EFD8772
MRLALLGTGKIVREVLDAVKDLSQIELKVIWAREHSRDKAAALAEKYGIPAVSTDYEELLARDDIDFIYVGLINSVHYAYAKKALLAGKHVILEKPFCPTEKETTELIALAKEKHLFLFEAVSFLHMPNFHFLQQHLKDVGKIKLVQANYSQYSSRYDAYRKGIVLPAFDPEVYGGALYDINFYNITLATNLFGAPTDFDYTPNIGFNGVDTSGIMKLQYPDFQAVCIGAKDSESPCFFIVQGEDGWLAVKGGPNRMDTIVLKQHGQMEKTVTLNGSTPRLAHEFAAFDRFWHEGRYEEAYEKLAATQQVMHILEQSRCRMLKNK